MSVWVYDHKAQRHTKVEAESVEGYIEHLRTKYAEVVKMPIMCEQFGQNQSNLWVFATRSHLAFNAARMVISVYEKAEPEVKAGSVIEVLPDNVINVEQMYGGPSDDGSFGLFINDQVFRVQMPVILRLAAHVIALAPIMNFINAMKKGETKCA